MEVGRISARLEAVFDDDGFDKFDRALRGARDDSRRPVEAELRADYDGSDFDQFERNIGSARRGSRRAVEQELRGDFDGSAFKKYDRAVGDAEKGSGRLGRTMGKVGGAAKVAGAGMAAGAAGAAFLGKTFVETAADIGESTSKIETIIGKRAAQTIQEFGKTSAQSFGMSRAAALEAGGSFAGMFKMMGQGNQESANMSVRMTKLAADMASFNNASPEEALTALQSGLRGEAEPLRRFNVMLDDATLRQQAMKDGLVKTTKEALTPQQKAMAAYGVIMKQTKVQQGDFSRTSEGLPNQMRRFKASLSDAGAELGEKLLPVVTNVVDGLNDLMSGGKGAGGAIDTLKRAGKGVADVFGTVAGAISSFVNKNRGTFDSIGESISGLFSSVKRYVGGIGKVFGDVFGGGSGIGGDLNKIGGFILGVVDVVLKLYNATVKRALPGILGAFKGLATVVRGVVRVISGILSGDFTKIWDGVKDIFRGAIRAIGGIMRAVTAPMREVFSKVPDIAEKAVKGMIGFLRDLPGKAWGAIKGLVGKWVDLNISLRRKALDGAENVVGAVFRTVKKLPGKVWDAIKAAPGKVFDMGRNLAQRGRDAGQALFDGIINKVADIPGKVFDKLKGVPGKVKSALSGMGSAIVGALGSAADMGKSIANAVIGLLNDAIPNSLDVPGPNIDLPDNPIPTFARGGKLTSPVFIAGEEAPAHPEFVISTNPRDRGRMIPLILEAAQYLGIAAFKKGGKTKKAAPKKPASQPKAKPAAAKSSAKKPAAKPAARATANKPAANKNAPPKTPGEKMGGDTLEEQIAEARLWVTQVEGTDKETSARENLKALLQRQQGSINQGLKSTAKKWKQAPAVRKTTTKAIGAAKKEKKKLEKKLKKAEKRLAATPNKKPKLEKKRQGTVNKLKKSIAAKEKRIDKLNTRKKTVGSQKFFEEKRTNLLGDLDSITGEIKGEQAAIDAIADEAAEDAEEKSAANWTLDQWMNWVGEGAAIAAARAKITKGVADGDEAAQRAGQGELRDAYQRAWDSLSASPYTPPTILDELASELSSARDSAKEPDPSGEIDAYLTADEKTALAALTKDEQTATATADTADDLAVANRAVTFWQGVWDRVQGDATLPSDVRGSIASALSGARSAADSAGGGSAPPTPAEIAAAANAQLQGFQSARAELFGGFGSNFAPSGSAAFGDATQQAAGARFFGAASGGAGAPVGAVAPTGDSKQVTVIQNYKTQPPAPHTWSTAMEYELRAAL